MPKTTFENLPLEKQLVLIKAAKEEFSRAPLHEASISNIIKEAGIPRGSFYQYFEDKEDIFFYLLEEESRRVIDHLYAILRINNGDLFESFKDWFKSILMELEEPTYYQFFRHTVMNMSYKLEAILTTGFYENKFKRSMVDLNELVNLDQLALETEKDFFHITKILVSVMLQNLVEVYSNGSRSHEAIQNFSIELELLKRGFLIGKSLEE